MPQQRPRRSRCCLEIDARQVPSFARATFKVSGAGDAQHMLRDVPKEHQRVGPSRLSRQERPIGWRSGIQRCRSSVGPIDGLALGRRTRPTFPSALGGGMRQLAVGQSLFIRNQHQKYPAATNPRVGGSFRALGTEQSIQLAEGAPPPVARSSSAERVRRRPSFHRLGRGPFRH